MLEVTIFVILCVAVAICIHEGATSGDRGWYGAAAFCALCAALNFYSIVHNG